MRTLPEITADLKKLVAELEEHTGLPQEKKSYGDNFYGETTYTLGEDVISLSGSNLNLNMDGMDVISLNDGYNYRT